MPKGSWLSKDFMGRQKTFRFPGGGAKTLKIPKTAFIRQPKTLLKSGERWWGARTLIKLLLIVIQFNWIGFGLFS